MLSAAVHTRQVAALCEPSRLVFILGGISQGVIAGLLAPYGRLWRRRLTACSRTLISIADLPMAGDARVARAGAFFGGWVRRGVPESFTTQLPVDASVVRSIHSGLASSGDERSVESAAMAAGLVARMVKINQLGSRPTQLPKNWTDLRCNLALSSPSICVIRRLRVGPALTARRKPLRRLHLEI